MVRGICYSVISNIGTESQIRVRNMSQGMHQKIYTPQDYSSNRSPIIIEGQRPANATTSHCSETDDSLET